MKKIFLIAGLVLSLNAFAQIPSYVPTDSLNAYYSFAGNANDLSINGNNGTVNGATLTSDKFGIANNAYSFNGSSNFINIPQPFLYGAQDSSFTTYSRFKINSSGNYSIWNKSLFWGEVGLYVLSNNQVQFVWANYNNGNTYSTVLSNVNSISINTWTDIIITFSNSQLKIYINGVLAPSTETWSAQGGAIISNSQVNSYCNFAQDINSNFFGRATVSGSYANYLNGIIDEFAIWNRALTQTEITALYNGCTTASITSSTTTICGSGSIVLTANANTSYQWKKNNVVIAGATNQTYSAIATGSYTVTTINSCNSSSTSNAIQINKYALPTSTIIANGSTSFCTGGSVTLSSTTNAGANALYQWYKGATAISGATNSSYIAITASTYKCKVTNSLTSCNRTSAGIIVTLHDPTSSITAGGPLTFCAGGNVLFTAVTNAGAGALYQWYKNSTGLSGATNSTYTATLAGNYVVVVTNSYGCTKASAIKKVIINCRLEEEGVSEAMFVSPNPCTNCFVNGTMNEQDLMVTDIVGRKQNASFSKSANGYYINLPEASTGIFLIRNIKTGEVVKFVKQ